MSFNFSLPDCSDLLGREDVRDSENGKAPFNSTGIVVRSSGRQRRRMTIYLPPDLATQLKVQAVLQDREMSEIVTDAVEMYLTRALPRPGQVG